MKHLYLSLCLLGMFACTDSKTASETPSNSTTPVRESVVTNQPIQGNSQREIDSLTQAIAEFETRYKKRAELLSENLTEKERLHKELEQARRRQGVSPASLRQKEARIKELDDKILTAESRISLMEDTVRLFRMVINAQGQMLLERDEKIEKLEDHIAELESKNLALKEENSALKKRIAGAGATESIPKGANFKFNNQYFSYSQDVFYIDFEEKAGGKPVVDTEEARTNLSSLQKLLTENPDLKVQLIGESSADVDKATRLQGAQGRVDRLKDYLIREQQIPGGRIKTRSRAKGTNNTRVDVQIVR